MELWKFGQGRFGDGWSSTWAIEAGWTWNATAEVIRNNHIKTLSKLQKILKWYEMCFGWLKYTKTKIEQVYFIILSLVGTNAKLLINLYYHALLLMFSLVWVEL